MRNRAFTLIELLVVVLIIGILAAIALPQYAKAVEKSKATQAFTMLKSAYEAAAVYYMANGEYPNSFADMGFEVPWTGNTKWSSIGREKDTKSNGEWSLELYHAENGKLIVYIGRISGKYSGAGFETVVVETNGTLQPLKIRCAERINGGISFSENLSAGDYCTKIMNATQENDSSVSSYRVYKMP